MKRQIPIQALTVGMFVEADVRSEVVDGQERYYEVNREIFRGLTQAIDQIMARLK